MSTAFARPETAWNRALDIWRELHVPEGWRPELTAEGICMTPPPTGQHNLTASSVHDALASAELDGCGILQTLGVGIRATGSIYVPDLCVVPRDAVPDNSDPVPAEKKKWAYAHGGIPQYLLIDAYDEDGPAVSLFTEPVQGVSSRTVRVPFGQPVEVGDPFGIRLETTEF
ncbi:Uma2 family endonuclease [Amycolatopsis sp. NPDC006131]|uniref:Uma2 family endonuclease n=1 Tax=Amycolatopsis sp. NPDC006131 TaxID=3156731 RepID=UPI0033B1F27A